MDIRWVMEETGNGVFSAPVGRYQINYQWIMKEIGEVFLTLGDRYQVNNYWVMEETRAWYPYTSLNH